MWSEVSALTADAADPALDSHPANLLLAVRMIQIAADLLERDL